MTFEARVGKFLFVNLFYGGRKLKKTTKGILAALIANIIFGFSFIFSKQALNFAEPLIILTVRFFVSFVSLNVFMLFSKQKIALRGKPKTRLIVMAIAQPFLYFIFELYGLSMVSSALSGVIIALVPVVVTIFSGVFLKEKPTKLQLLFTIIALIAVSVISIISNDGTKNYALGVVLLALAVICAAIFNISSRAISNVYTPFERTYIMFLMAFFGFLITSFYKYKSGLFSAVFEAACEPQFLIAILYLSVLSSVLAFLLYNYSTTTVSAIQSASFSNIIPVVTVLAGVLLLKEHFSIVEYLLCAIVVLSVWGVNFFVKKY